MKKFITIILSTLMIVTCLSLTACSGNGKKPSADSQYIGTWKATKAEILGESADLSEVLSADYTVELKADGTAVVSYKTSDNGTWTENSKGIHVTAGETDADFKVDGNTLYISFLGAKVIFEKQ